MAVTLRRSLAPACPAALAEAVRAGARGRAALFGLAAALALALLCLAGAPAPAQAQQGGGFFDFLRPPAAVPQPSRNRGGWRPDTLFRPAEPPRQAPPVQRAPVRKREVKEARPAPPEPQGIVYASAEAATQGRKNPPTQFVLVLGDELAGRLSQGLADALLDDRDTRAVIARTEDESGFLPTPYDWAPKLADAIAAARANVAVVALGSTDLEPLKDGVGFAQPLTERWLDLYTRRVDELLAQLRDRMGGRVIVMGLPPVQNAGTSADYARLNEVLRARAARAGLIFSNIWDGFVDEDGKFSAIGPAVDGQKRRLRGADGVGFTRAGARKLAFFVEKDLNRLLADPSKAAPTSAALSLSGAPASARALAGAGAGVPAAPAKPSGPSRALLLGDSGPPVRGRADDFSWPPPDAPVPAALRTPAEPAAPAPPAAAQTPANIPAP